MKALILAAGYGTRLYPVIIDRPKALLPVNDRPLIDYLLDKIENCAQLTEVLVVTNEKFHDDFRQWAEKCTATFDKPIRVINDGTTTPDDRLGAMEAQLAALQQELTALRQQHENSDHQR